MQPIFWEGAVPWSLVLVHPSNLPPGSSLLYVEKDKKRGALCPKWPEPAAPLLSISFLETTQCGNSCLACSSSALAALWAGALFCKVLRLCFVWLRSLLVYADFAIRMYVPPFLPSTCAFRWFFLSSSNTAPPLFSYVGSLLMQIRHLSIISFGGAPALNYPAKRSAWLLSDGNEQLEIALSDWSCKLLDSNEGLKISISRLVLWPVLRNHSGSCVWCMSSEFLWPLPYSAQLVVQFAPALIYLIPT